MTQVRWTMFLVSVPVFSQAAEAALSDRFSLKLASAQSLAHCAIETGLGPCVIAPRAERSLAGSVEFVLHSDSIPISGGQFDGGRCSAAPEMVGIIPSSLPGLPPALVVHLDSLTIEPRTRAFTCDANGCFLAESSASVLDGHLDVSVQGGDFVSVPILGLTAERSRSRGRVWIDGSGIHVVWAFENTIHARVPGSDLGLRIAMRNLIQGDIELPVPTRMTNATASPLASSAGNARLPEKRFSPSEEPLLATLEKSGRARAAAFPDHLGPLLIRDDERIAEVQGSRPVARLVSGSRWYFQFAYREVTGGELLSDGSPGTVLDTLS